MAQQIMLTFGVNFSSYIFPLSLHGTSKIVKPLINNIMLYAIC